jgi:hypothetical protein
MKLTNSSIISAASAFPPQGREYNILEGRQDKKILMYRLEFGERGSAGGQALTES